MDIRDFGEMEFPKTGKLRKLEYYAGLKLAPGILLCDDCREKTRGQKIISTQDLCSDCDERVENYAPGHAYQYRQETQLPPWRRRGTIAGS